MKKNNILFVVIIFGMALIMCWGYISGHYSTDNYNIINIGYNQYSIVNNLKEGRLIMYLIDQLALRINLNYNAFIVITVCLAILITSITCVLFYNIIIKYYTDNKINKLLILIVSYTIFFNFMYIENLYYVESVVMAFALLLYLIAANYQVNKNKILVPLLLGIIANFCYNGFQCYFITIISVLSLFKNRMQFKKVVKDILIAGWIVIIAVILNLIQIEIVCLACNLKNTRIGSITNFPGNIVTIFINAPVLLLNTVDLFPKFAYIICVILIYIIAFIFSIKNKEYNLLFETSVMIIVSILSCFCIFVFTLSSFGTGRLLYGVGMTIGILLLILIKYMKIYKTNTIIDCGYIALVLMYYIIIMWNAIYLINLHKKVNQMEKEEILQLETIIQNYEKQENITVNKVTYVLDKTTNRARYNMIKRSTTVTDRALGCKWAYVGAINFYTHRNLVEIDSSEEIVNIYSKMSNDNSNGIVCYNDTLICPISIW